MKSCFLVGCSSINYKLIKNILFHNIIQYWLLSKNYKFKLYFQIINNEGYCNENKFLKILGNLQIFMNLKNIRIKK